MIEEKNDNEKQTVCLGNGDRRPDSKLKKKAILDKPGENQTCIDVFDRSVDV